MDPGATCAPAATTRMPRVAPPAPATELLVAYVYDYIARVNPVGMLGMVHVLEGTSSALATRAARSIAATLALPPAAFSYLTSHGALDQEHVRFFEDTVNAATSEELEHVVTSRSASIACTATSSASCRHDALPGRAHRRERRYRPRHRRSPGTALRGPGPRRARPRAPRGKRRGCRPRGALRGRRSRHRRRTHRRRASGPQPSHQQRWRRRVRLARSPERRERRPHHREANVLAPMQLTRRLLPEPRAPARGLDRERRLDHGLPRLSRPRRLLREQVRAARLQRGAAPRAGRRAGARALPRAARDAHRDERRRGLRAQRRARRGDGRARRGRARAARAARAPARERLLGMPERLFARLNQLAPGWSTARSRATASDHPPARAGLLEGKSP